MLKIDSFYALTSKKPNNRSYLIDKGWFKSYRTKKSINQKEEAIPWLTYPFLDFIEQRLQKEMELFEYGCGNSTLWFSQRVKKVYSVEHNKDWYNIVRKKIPHNCSLKLKKLNSEEYVSSSSKNNIKFDIIIIDGRKRVECIKKSINNIKYNGIIILDNSERKIYEDGINYLLNHEFKKLDFYGMSPIGARTSCTSVFYKKNNCIYI